MLTKYFIPVLLVSSAQLVSSVTSALANNTEDVRLEFCDMVRQYINRCDEYNVTTTDGYILRLARISGDPNKPVFLQHGFLDSAYTWILRGLKSIASWLANKNYDIWIGNTRGNMLSRAHVTLNPDLLKFWEFSFHEMALYDIPAFIDFILEETGQTKLQVIAHSQGTSLFYVLGSLKPEYGSKIKHVLCLAPIAYLHHAQKPLFSLVSLAGGPLLSQAAGFLGHGEFLRNSSVLGSLFQLACTRRLIGYVACGLGVASVLFGPDPEQFEPEFARKAFKYYPAGSSMKNAVHLLQIVASKRFQQYDYGAIENLIKYDSLQPPVYDLSKVPFNISLYVGKNDRLSAIEDVKRLRVELSHVVKYHVMEYEKWNHVDFIWGSKMDKYLFGPMLETLIKYN